MSACAVSSVACESEAPFWRRLLRALGIGLMATFAGAAAGAVLLALFGAAVEGWSAWRSIPPFLFYGVIFGPVLAWPVTLVVLPAVWVVVPRRFRRVALLVIGPLAGAAVIVERMVNEVGTGTGALDTAMVLAGTAGGLAAGVLFAAFVPRAMSGRESPPDRRE